ncbi:hypothetical protein GCM10023196_035850 [Actinoallomurus vinaceus]|uniref:Uncharacterized protein n=1 Tax=Actinoallomurus vinaceus TaxID=1080074 RepID=A0ABP8UAK2_9ACTN
MSDLTTWLIGMIGRRTPPAAEPKPGPTPEPAAAEEPVPARLGNVEPPQLIRVITTQAEPEEPDPTKPTHTHYEAAYTELERHREDIALEELADAIAEHSDPWAAAIETFGGDR